MSDAAETPAMAEEKPKRPWLRTQLESFAVAIAMALVIKQFAFEAFRVPTESMEPSIIGRESLGDQLIVGKLDYLWRDPKRWEIGVFRYPLSQPVNYVKRFVGMPGDELWLCNGDVWLKQDDGTWKAATKPRAVQQTLFERHPAIAPDKLDSFSRAEWNAWFVLGDPAERGLRLDGGSLTMSDGDLLRTKSSVVSPSLPGGEEVPLFCSERRDEMASSRGGKQDAVEAEALSDFRIELDVAEASGANALQVVYFDGSRRPVERAKIEVTLPLEGGTAPALTVFGKAVDVAWDPRIGEGEACAVEFVDDMLRVEIDGEVVLEHFVPDTPQPNQVRRPSWLGFGPQGGTARFDRVRIERDIHYTQSTSTPSDGRFDVPEGHYLMLGDNSPNSLDGREFRISGIRLRADGRVLLGDMEGVNDSLSASRYASNPRLEEKRGQGASPRSFLDRLFSPGQPDPSKHHFIDILGNRHQLEEGSYDLLDLSAFPQGGTARILTLHGTKMAADPDRIAIPAVTTTALRQRVSNGSELISGPFRTESPLMNYVPRDHIVGRPYFVFFPFPRMGPIR